MLYMDFRYTYYCLEVVITYPLHCDIYADKWIYGWLIMAHINRLVLTFGKYEYKYLCNAKLMAFYYRWIPNDMLRIIDLGGSRSKSLVLWRLKGFMTDWGFRGVLSAVHSITRPTLDSMNMLSLGHYSFKVQYIQCTSFRFFFMLFWNDYYILNIWKIPNHSLYYWHERTCASAPARKHEIIVNTLDMRCIQRTIDGDLSWDAAAYVTANWFQFESNFRARCDSCSH